MSPAGARTGRVAALVLAAGSGTRFGDATKQLAVLDGLPLVCHVVATARGAGLGPVLVVTGHDAARVAAALPDGVEVVHNPDHDHGQAGSLRVGLAALADADVGAVAVLLADEPGVSLDVVDDVVAAWRGGARAARAVHDDRPGHPVVLDRSTWDTLAEARGDQGARQLLAGLQLTPVRVPGPAPRDVDTPADLATLRDAAQVGA